MSNPIKASPTTSRDLATDKEITATAATGSKYALDVNLTNATVSTAAAGLAPVDKARKDYSSGTVTTAAYTTLIASTAAAATRIEIFDSSGETLLLAFGAAASEVDKIYILPGGNGSILLTIPVGTRLSIKAVSANASTGELTVNLYG